MSINKQSRPGAPPVGSMESMSKMPRRSRARQIVNVSLNVFGIIAAGLGIYFVFEMVSGIVMLASFANPKQPTGPAGPALAIVGLLGFFGIFVFGMLAAVCITIAAWILEPVRRWQEWRAKLARG